LRADKLSHSARRAIFGELTLFQEYYSAKCPLDSVSRSITRIKITHIEIEARFEKRVGSSRFVFLFATRSRCVVSDNAMKIVSILQHRCARDERFIARIYSSIWSNDFTARLFSSGYATTKNKGGGR
jgi:hypothetical protein